MPTRRALMLTTLAGLSPLGSGAQPSARLRKIGMLSNVEASDPASDPAQVMFIASLRALGWEEGKTVSFLYRSSGQKNERFPGLARDLVANGVDLIVVAAGVTAALAVKQATATIPILVVGVADPVGFGLVTSLAHPGGNVTGLTAPVPDWGKYVEIAHEAVPGSTRIAVIGNSTNVAYADYVEHNTSAARQLGLKLQMIPVTRPEEIAPAFEAMRRERSEVLIFGPDRLYLTAIDAILDMARTARIPVIAPFRTAADRGALVSYGIDNGEMVREAASYANRLLQGVAPADLPMSQPTRFKLVINMKTAKALGLSVPQSLLLRADDVIV